ncbi:MAG: M14 family zinc carboxypeptidase [Bacteriovoracaceae bacterium]|nr:M14 family zinc carboxypeptidase [Bacteriovoracaceae bacterium]
MSEQGKRVGIVGLSVVFQFLFLYSGFARNAEMAKKFPRSFIEESYYVHSSDPSVAQTLSESPSFIIDHHSQHGFEIYGPEGLGKTLDQLQVRHQKLEQLELKNFKRALEYPSFEKFQEKLKQLALKYPKILKLFSIGKSIQGRDLWVMKISDNVEVDEAEPEFKYISSMHGDEIVGRELTTMLVEDLAKEYVAGRPRIKNLIENTELFIMPSMNPDGSFLKQRANAIGVDLNRNFPPLTVPGEKSFEQSFYLRPEAIAKETNLVMEFQKSRHFALSANFHGGAVVVNYPWDHTTTRHPLDEFLQEISRKYARKNSEMFQSTEFRDGITEGADWYAVKGGMQDWSYLKYGDLQLTIELSQEKYPSYSKIPGYYQRNKESMIQLMEQVRQGAGFYDVQGELSKLKRVPKKVRIKSDDRQSLNLGPFDFDKREFYAVLPKGDYVFEILDANSSVIAKVSRQVR